MRASKTAVGHKTAFLCMNTVAQRGTAVQKKKPFKKTESGDQFVELDLVVAMEMELQTGIEESVIMSPHLQDSLIS